jgi:hypothetical protein
VTDVVEAVKRLGGDLAHELRCFEDAVVPEARFQGAINIH